MPPLMPAAKFRPVRPSTTTAPTGHVLAGVIADALDDGARAAVAHGEPLAGDTAHERVAAGCAVERHVADDDVLFGDERCTGGGRTTRRPPERPLPTKSLASPSSDSVIPRGRNAPKL